MAHRCRLLRIRRPCFLRRRRAPKPSPAPSPSPTSSSSSSSSPGPLPSPRRTRLATRPKSPCPQALRQKKCPKKKRVVVVAWKRVTRALRRESKGGLPAGFALIVVPHHPHRTLLESARQCELELESAEAETERTVVAATTCSETDTSGSGWSLV